MTSQNPEKSSPSNHKKGNANGLIEAHKVLICQGIALFKTNNEIIDGVWNDAKGLYDDRQPDPRMWLAARIDYLKNHPGRSAESRGRRDQGKVGTLEPGTSGHKGYREMPGFGEIACESMARRLLITGHNGCKSLRLLVTQYVLKTSHVCATKIARTSAYRGYSL